MAARVNTRFILFLVASVAAAGAIIVGLLFLQMRGDAARQVRLAEELLEQGDLENAIIRYGRAARLDPGNLQTLASFESTLRAFRPETGDVSRDYYGRLLAALNQAAQYHPSRADTHTRLIEELYSSARLLSMLAPPAAHRGTWEMIVSAADDMLLNVPSTDPDYAVGQLYRGMAKVQLRTTISDSELERALEDLAAFVEAFPEHDLGWATLANAHRQLAAYHRNSGHSRRAAAMRERLPQAMRSALDAVPDGPEVNLAYARFLAEQRRENQGDVAQEEVSAAVFRAADLAMDADHPWLVLEVAQLLQTSGGPEGAARAKDLYRHYLERNPEAMAHRYFLAQLMYRTGELDEAREITSYIIDAEPLRVGFLSQMQLTVRRLAAAIDVDIEHQRYLAAIEAGESPSEQPIVEARERLVPFVVDQDGDSSLLRADAKLAMVRDDYAKAAANFERLIRDGNADAETYTYSAYCLEQIGQIGLAHERTVAALGQLGQNNPYLMLRRSRLEYLMGRLDEASESIAAFRQVNPDDRQGIALARAIDARLRGEEIETDDPAILAIREADAALQTGDTDTARATIIAAIEDGNQTEVRLFDAAARIEMIAGRTEEAQAFVSQGLLLQPEHRRLRQLEAVLETGDPIAAARRYMQSEYEDEAERSVSLLVALGAIDQQHRSLAETQTAAGEMDKAQENRAIASEAAAAAERELARATELAPNDGRLIEYQFAKALADEEWSLAETLSNRARDLNIDQARGLLFRGRLELARGRPESAVRAFQQATEMVSYSSNAWRGLGIAYQRVGNLREAQRAYDQAYRTNPNDVNTIRSYLALLVQTGEYSRAVRIARSAHRLMPRDHQMREAWLDLEAQVTNLPVVFTTRREIYEADPSDITNARQLALVLGRSEPSPELILEADGSRTYSELRWSRLTPQDQQRRLAEARSEWHREADQILDDLEQRDGASFELASLRAILLQNRGQVRQGEQILQEFIDNTAPSDVSAAMLLGLGQYQIDSGRVNEGMATYQRALAIQDPQQREADLAIGNLLFSRNAFEQAIEHFEKVLAVAPNLDVELRVVEAMLNQRKYDEADQRLRRALAERSPDFVSSMIMAMIAHGQATQLFERGRTAEAEVKLEAHRQAIDTAERMMPTNPTPHVVRARTLLADYHRTGQRTLLHDALTSLNRADTIRPQDNQTSMTRIEIFRAMGNVSSAVTELERVVERSPANLQYRRMLVQLHVEMNNHAAAISVIQRAIERYPTMVAWHEMLGSVHAARGDMTSAMQAFRRAFELDGSVSSLLNYVGTLMSGDQPDYQAVVNLLRNVPEHVDEQPILGASLAVALHQTNRADASRAYLQRSFQKQRQLIQERGLPDGEINRWYQVVSAKFARQSPAEVEQTIRALTDDQPGPLDLLWMARRWQQSGVEGSSRATELMSQAVDQAGPNLRLGLQFELANYYLQFERYEAAATTYHRILRDTPDHAGSLNNLAFILASYLDDAESALPHARRAHELAGDDAAVLDTLGWVHFKLGNYTQAEDLLRRSVGQRETAGTIVHLAHVFIANGEYDAALARLRRAAELNPDSKLQAEIDRLADDIRTNRTRAR